jgi:hypothetical protein
MTTPGQARILDDAYRRTPGRMRKVRSTVDRKPRGLSEDERADLADRLIERGRRSKRR